MTKLQKDLQKLAKNLSILEGKGKQVPIGQIREIMKCLAVYEAAQAVLYMRSWEPKPQTKEECYAIAKDVQSQTYATLAKYKDDFLWKLIKKEYK